jgi:zinc/manganese transport system substrate-binding protein
MMHARQRITSAAVIAAVAVMLAGCGSSTSPGPAASEHAASGPVNVVASTNVWGDIAKQIGAEHANVTSILVDPTADPHQFDTDAKTAAAVSKSQLAIENGLNYDNFMDELLLASPDANRHVVNAAEVMKISGEDADPHIWYDIAKVPDVAMAISTELARLDPADAATFTANAKSFTDSLAPINVEIANIKANYPGAPVGYTERVPGYLVDAAGLKLATPASFAQSIEDGNDPSVADNSAMDAALTGRAIRVLLYNGQVTSPATDAVKQLAQRNRVPVVAIAETLPPTDQNFQSWQLRQVNALIDALSDK